MFLQRRIVIARLAQRSGLAQRIALEPARHRLPAPGRDGGAARAGRWQGRCACQANEVASSQPGRGCSVHSLIVGEAGNGNLLYALELFHNDGLFVVPDNYRKANGVLRYSEGTRADGFNLTAMAYGARWHATDQIPQRALADGTLASRFDAIDQTDGGEAERYVSPAHKARSHGTSSSKVNAYFVRNTLKLLSNFTYFMDDPVNGDQFAQPDARVTAGLDAGHTWNTPRLGKESASICRTPLAGARNSAPSPAPAPTSSASTCAATCRPIRAATAAAGSAPSST